MASTGEDKPDEVKTSEEQKTAAERQETTAPETNDGEDQTVTKAKSEENIDKAEENGPIDESNRSKSKESLGKLEETQRSKSRESLDHAKRSKSKESLGSVGATIDEDKRSKSKESLDESKRSKSRESLDQAKRSKSKESLGSVGAAIAEENRSKSRESLGQAKIDDTQRSKSKESLGQGSTNIELEEKRSKSKENIDVTDVVVTEATATTSDKPDETPKEEEDDIKPVNRICDKCDSEDADDVVEGKKQKFVIQGKQFRNTSTLPYKITGYTRDLSRNLQNEIFARAFKTWSEVANLNFKQVTRGRAAINISFHRGKHGDGEINAFDGAWGVLAHAEFGGDIHFDEAEAWTHESRRGVNLLQVAVHEIGHSLGLKHSQVREAVMFANYNGYDPNFALHPDDIAGIQRIYGERDSEADDAARDGDKGDGDSSCCLIDLFRSICKKK